MANKTATAVRYDEIKGKVVSGAGFGWSNMLIAFTDGTVLSLTADDCDGPEISFEQREIDLTSSHWAGEALEAGLIENAEYLESRKRHNKETIERLEAQLANMKNAAS